MMPREELLALQLERLKILEKCFYNVPHYRKAFQEIGFEPRFKFITGLINCQFTYKTDLRDNYLRHVCTLSKC